MTAPTAEIPLELEKDVARFVLSLPDADEMEETLRAVVKEVRQQVPLQRQLDAKGQRRLARNLAGLTLDEARRVLRRCLLDRQRLDQQTVADVLVAKRAALGRGGILEVIELGAGFDKLGGLRRLKQWLELRRRAFSPEAAKFGLEPPRGILILGVQGCGKSLLAKAVASDWQLPLVRLDPGRLYDKFMGESERRLRQSLEVATKMAPLVLWIDEIEKGFATTASSADVDAGLSQRLLGTMLAWLQEKRAPVFVGRLPATTSLLSRPICCAKGASMRFSLWICPTGKGGAKSFGSISPSASATRKSSTWKRWRRPARASAERSSSRWSSPLSTTPSRLSSSWPPNTCWLRSGTRIPWRSPAAKTLSGCVLGRGAAPSLPIDAHRGARGTGLWPPASIDCA